MQVGKAERGLGLRWNAQNGCMCQLLLILPCHNQLPHTVVGKDNTTQYKQATLNCHTLNNYLLCVPCCVWLDLGTIANL